MGVFEDDTKNRTSNRIIKIPQTAVNDLKQYRKHQLETRLKVGDRWQETDRIFTTEFGAPLHPDTLSSWFSSFVKAHSDILPPISLHSLRHTNATLMIASGVPITTVSKRFVAVPSETIALLKIYKSWQNREKKRLGSYYHNYGFLFTQENGKPMHPDSVTDYLDKFSDRYGLPHVNSKAFRHTMASMLYFNGIDSVSISRRLGHAQVSTTANIYAHVMDAADKKNAEVISDIYLKKKNEKG